jgi:hypothetical protein
MLNNIKAIALLFNEIAAVVNYCILKVWPRRYNRARMDYLITGDRQVGPPSLSHHRSQRCQQSHHPGCVLPLIWAMRYWPILEKTASRQALPPSSAIDWRSAGASSPSSSPILPPVKWWPTPAANAGISPFWLSTRRGRRPCALLLPISPFRGPRW